MDDFRPHLLITEDDVEHIENKPTGRTKDRGVDKFEHGTKLSEELRSVVDTYTKVQNGDSLSEEDIRLFEVILPEGEKFANKSLRDFLSKEGMSITSVRDSRHAIVSSTKSKVDSLLGRVGDYRDSKPVDSRFQFIDGFGFPKGTDKQSRDLRELLATAIGEVKLDVEIREELLAPRIGIDRFALAEQKLIDKIGEYNGSVIGQPYLLTDETHIIRAKIPVEHIDDVSNDTIVCHVAQTGFYGTTPAACMEPAVEMSLNPNVNIEALPIVAVLDTGVDFPAVYEPLIIEHWVPTGAKPGDKKHGTNVASKVAFSNIGNQLSNGEMIPRARIIDCNIRGEDPNSDNPELISNETMIKRIREAVLRYQDITKIFNLSSAARIPIKGDQMSILGRELDALNDKYGVKFIISTGNHDLYRTEDSLSAMLGDDEIRIAAPSDAMLNISVGAVVASDDKYSLSKQYDVAPYSRIGPGFKGFRKPDIVTYAGNKRKNGQTIIDAYSMMLGAGGKWALDAGTSFAAPVIAGDLAEIANILPDHNILMAECLLYHAAEMPTLKSSKKKGEQEDPDWIKLRGDCYGRGIAAPLSSMYSSNDRVTFIHTGKMNKLDKQRVKFLMPKVVDGLDMKSQDSKIKITVTCLCQSPVDYTKGSDYLGAYVNASFHFINRNGTAGSNNPKTNETDGRNEWDVCYHFDKPISSFASGDWEIWLQLYTRYDIEDTQNIDYALAITVEDLTHSLQLYDSIQAEAQDRFPAVQMVRVPIRY